MTTGNRPADGGQLIIEAEAYDEFIQKEPKALKYMRNTYKYTKLYSGGEPAFIEGDVFRTIVPLNDVSVGVVGPEANRNNVVTDQVSDQDSDQVNDQDITLRILKFCESARSKKEICEHFGYGNLTYFTRTYLKPLLESSQLKMTIPEAPSSRNQKYIKS